jgi:hypothetical protein
LILFCALLLWGCEPSAPTSQATALPERGDILDDPAQAEDFPHPDSILAMLLTPLCCAYRWRWSPSPPR